MAPPADGRLPNSNGASSNGVKLQRFYDGEKGSTSNAHRHDFLEGPFAHDLRAETPPRLYSTSTSAHSSPALFPTTPNRLSLSKRDAVESEISRRSPLEGCLKCFGRVDIAVGEPRILRVSEPMVYDPPRRAAFQGPRDPSLWGSHDHGPMAIHRLRASTRRIDVQPSSAQQISEHEELLSAARHSDSSLDGNGPTRHHSRHIRTTTETVSNSPGSDYLVSKHPSARVSPSSAPSAPFSPLSFGELSGGRDHFRNRPTPWDSRPESPPSAFTPDELRLLTPTRSRSEPDLTNLRSPDWGSRVPEGTKQLLSPLDRADPNSPRSAVPHIHKRQLVFAPTSTTGGKVQRRSNPDHFPLNRRHGDVTAPLEPRGPPYAVLADEILDVAGIATRKKPPHIADRFKKLKRTVSGCFGGSCGSPESTATSSATLLSKSKKIEPKQLVGKRRYTWASQYASPGVPSTPLKGEAKLKEDLRLHSLAMRNLDKELYAKFGIAPKDGTSFGSPLQAGRGWIGSPPSRLDSPRRSDGSISSISSTDWHTPKFKPSTVPSTPQRLNEPELAPELTRQFSTSSGSSAEDAKELRRILGNLPEKAHLSALHSLGASSPPPRKISTGW
ncbi:hypothetical protein CBOM_02169 [Ceraceosorus bombacis]|uniref:Uncharacterized protein n=1 Tax=Ceraceosorus bombacis TaxID=401625 RepID=A0A0P1BE02_9BASI|nr:hypothetical protein CBOM_02169 [Ceraceosorus bombacis]